ncbi:hypothetical protein Sjap_000767 [Stephania japonica]|uniref:Uncharacterized protein n=1 Tax=Stephania japonica TaxID=461633 RepID=A0AAP0KL27_9MAGN
MERILSRSSRFDVLANLEEITTECAINKEDANSNVGDGQFKLKNVVSNSEKEKGPSSKKKQGKLLKDVTMALRMRGRFGIVALILITTLRQSSQTLSRQLRLWCEDQAVGKCALERVEERDHRPSVRFRECAPARRGSKEERRGEVAAVVRVLEKVMNSRV